MKKTGLGIIVGAIAGTIDVVPMIIQDLTWDANLSAFTMWVVIGFFVSVIEIKINAILKGLLIAFLVLLPTAILIGWNQPDALIPIGIMTTILGGLLGFTLDKLLRKQVKNNSM